MLNNKKQKKKLFYALWPTLTTLGFVEKIREEGFWRSFKGGFGSITFVFSDNALNTEVMILAEIRLDELENLKNQGRSDISNREKSKTFSFSDESGYLSGHPFPQKWFFDAETDLDDLAEGISDTLLNTLVPYLETYSNMERALDYMLEYEDPKAYTSFETAAINSVGLAFLLRRRDLDDIISAKSEFLQEKGKGSSNEFFSFVGQIKTPR